MPRPRNGSNTHFEKQTFHPTQSLATGADQPGSHQSLPSSPMTLPSGNDANWSVNRQLALSGVKSASAVSPKFTGKDPTTYLQWKLSLKEAVKGLQLMPFEWLEILEMRTSHKAAEIVQCARQMALDDPNIAIEHVWRELERKYNANPQTAKRLFKKLKNFSTVSEKNLENLYDFAMACRQATLLAGTKRGGILTQLDVADLQKTVTSCLDERLRERWKRHYHKFRAGDPDRVVPFSEFSEWISDVADVQNNPDLQFDEPAEPAHRPPPIKVAPNPAAQSRREIQRNTNKAMDIKPMGRDYYEQRRATSPNHARNVTFSNQRERQPEFSRFTEPT